MFCWDVDLDFQKNIKKEASDKNLKRCTQFKVEGKEFNNGKKVYLHEDIQCYRVEEDLEINAEQRKQLSKQGMIYKSQSCFVGPLNPTNN